MTRLTRSGLLVHAARAGGAAAVLGAGAGLPASPAAAAPVEQDLAWIRFGDTLEYVLREFARQARASGAFDRAETRALERCTAAHVAHRAALRRALTDNGQAPIETADLEVDFPAGAFDARARIVSLGRRLGGLALSAYLGAVTTTQAQALRRLCAQIAASEAEQLAFLDALAGPPVGDPFPSVHGIDTASQALAAYLP
jgi:hypothetical protein